MRGGDRVNLRAGGGREKKGLETTVKPTRLIEEGG